MYYLSFSRFRQFEHDMRPVCKDPYIIIRTFDADGRLIGMDMRAAEHALHDSLFSLSVIRGKVFDKSRNGRITDLFSKQFLDFLSNHSIGCMQSQSFVD